MPTIRSFHLTLLCVFFASALCARAATVNATWNTASDVPVTAASYTATGNTVNFTLNFAPATGTNLTVVTNTGLPFISGTFDNLAQGQAVALSFGGATYNYVAHYYGGTGNDLVLVWANQRLFGWGANNYGVVGDGSNSVPRFTIVPVTVTQALAGKTVVALSQSIDHSMALCADGTVLAWGLNNYGQLGNNTTTDSYVPVAVNVTNGISSLYGKNVVAIAAGVVFSAALCSDGTVSTWGYNSSGQLGNNTQTNRSTPVTVNTANGISALYGKSVVNIATGNGHTLALCEDGSLVAWGDNTFGQMGNNSLGYSPVPVAVNTASGVSSLYGKSVVALAAGGDHSLALSSDGTVSSWGNNFYGNLGNNSTTRSSVPVAVNTTSGLSALYGKTLAAVAAGGYNNMGLCTDGSVVAWGYNNFGQLGNNSTTNSSVPVAVNTTSGVSALYGKAVVAMVTGGATTYNSTALCSDGTLTAWGYNSLGNLGNGGTTNSAVPVTVSTGPLGSGEKFVSPANNGSTAQSLVIVAEPIPTLTTLAATPGSTSAILNGAVNANNGTTVASFEYGTTTAYGSSIAATPNTVTGGSDTAVSYALTGLTPLSVYHYRLRAGGSTGPDQTFTTLNNDASLASLTTSVGSMNPVFAPGTTQYSFSLSSATDSIIMTPTCADSNATARVNGTAVSSGSASGVISLGYGDNIITIAVTAQDGVTKQVYTLSVTRSIPATLLATYLSASYVPVGSNGFTATGHSINFTLNFAPATGTNLTVVNNTGLPFIQGTFDNLAQGQAVALDYGGVTYQFAANYFGGSGNDLVLVWANNRALAWGDNTSGQIGDGTVTSRKLPMPVAMQGALAGKTVIAVTKGYNHALALCSDGTVAAWGSNDSGQLGDNTTLQRKVPVAVNTASGVSALYGKTVVSLAAGASHSMALCSDGTLVTWGSNTNGQLGNNSTTQSSTAVAVSTDNGVSALAGKTVIGIAANGLHNLALCTDGTVAAWGGNTSGELGDNTTVQRKAPVAVNTTNGISALYGKTVMSLAAGNYHNMALCTDGSLVTWGNNNFGQLGDNTTTQRNVPVAVNAVSGVSALAGKSVVAMAAGGQHNLALCTDGSVAAWGFNGSYQLGNGTATQRNVPVAVNAVSDVSSLYGRMVTSLSAGQNHSAAMCSDGTLHTWGSNSSGALGDDTVSSPRTIPGPVSTSTLAAGEQWCMLSNGSSGNDFNLAVAAAPSYATVATQTATDITGTSATLNGTAMPFIDSMAVSFEYGTTSAYGTTVSAVPTSIAHGTGIPVSAAISGLMPGTSYHFRVNGINGGSSLHGSDQTFTTPNNNADLANLAPGGSLSPPFSSDTLNYTLSVPYLTSSINILAMPADSKASMQINGVSKAPGSINWPVNLFEGSNTLSLLVTAQDGTTLKTYTLIVTRASGPSLSSFSLDSGTLSPAFNSNTTSYTVNVDSDTSTIAVTPSVVDGTTTVKVNDAAVASGSTSNPISLVYGDNLINTAVTSQDGSVTKTYALLVTRGIPTAFAAPFASGSTVPLTSRGLTAAGSTVNLTLNYAPVSGTTLTVVNNTSAGFINGAFSNVAQGQIVELNYNGVSYHFVANYFGGTGNDLILQWADSRAFAWGNDSSYQLGTQYSGDSIATPTSVVVSDFLSQRRILSLAAGGTHSMALCSDGSVAAWGSVNYGQLGVGSSVIQAPTALGLSTGSGDSALHGKSVIAVAAGGNHSLALCSDGTVAAWGHNSYGQLGVDLTIDQSALPLAADTSYGVSSLNGKTVVAIAAGSGHSLALCSDGTVSAWGDNSFGQLGTGSTRSSAMPVAVNTTAGVSVLCGKTVVAISAGGYHSMALCSDGTLVTWGWNSFGQLGDNSTTNKFAPVAVKTSNGVSALFGKTVVTMSAGGLHNLALCSDGTLVAWGANTVSQLGDTSQTTRLAPVKVYNVGALSAIFGKTVTSISAGASHSLALCSDGTMAAWGDNSSGQLGSPLSITTQVRPVSVQRNLLATAELFASAVASPNSSHGLALVATPPAAVMSLAATAVTSSSVTLNGTVNASNGYVPTSFDLGLTTAYGMNVLGSPTSVSGSSSQSTSVTLTGLSPATTYHFRANGGTYSGGDLTFTTLLSSLQNWRQTYFGTVANSGATADAADFDNDGIPNLLEWACNLDPTTRGALPLTTVRNGANIEFTYSRSTAAATSGAAFTVQWSDTLGAGSWSSSGVVQTVLSDDGTTQQVKAVIPINGTTAKFSRLSVTAP